jgi:mRNA interferase MazF
VAGGVYAAKPRPAVIVQDDLFDAMSWVTVAPITVSTLLDAPLMRIRVSGGDGRLSGLDHDSDVMIDKLRDGQKVECPCPGWPTGSGATRRDRAAMMAFLGLAR